MTVKELLSILKYPPTVESGERGREVGVMVAVLVVVLMVMPVVLDGGGCGGDCGGGGSYRCHFCGVVVVGVMVVGVVVGVVVVMVVVVVGVGCRVVHPKRLLRNPLTRNSTGWGAREN